jgi:hypothetical protein
MSVTQSSNYNTCNSNACSHFMCTNVCRKYYFKSVRTVNFYEISYEQVQIFSGQDTYVENTIFTIPCLHRNTHNNQHKNFFYVFNLLYTVTSTGRYGGFYIFRQEICRMNLYYFTYFCIDSDPLKNKKQINITNFINK